MNPVKRTINFKLAGTDGSLIFNVPLRKDQSFESKYLVLFMKSLKKG